MSRHRRDDAEGFGLLYVCTGNICRSPFAEILTRHLLVGRLGARAAEAIDVSSAGVNAVVGAQMHPSTRDELIPWGLGETVADRFVARQLRSAMIERSHLVLGAGPRHRSAVVELAPAALPTAFGLREFARLAASVNPSTLPDEPVARARALVEQARLGRGFVTGPSPDDDQIPDPMGRPQQAHRDAAVLIGAAVQTIVGLIAPQVPVGADRSVRH